LHEKLGHQEEEVTKLTGHYIKLKHYLFFGSDAPYTQHLQVFGKLAIVKVLNATNKLSNRKRRQHLSVTPINMRAM